MVMNPMVESVKKSPSKQIQFVVALSKKVMGLKKIVKHITLSQMVASLMVMNPLVFFFNPALHAAAAAASEDEEKETKMRALAPSPGTLTVVVFYV